jgi:hypothetical protein
MGGRSSPPAAMAASPVIPYLINSRLFIATPYRYVAEMPTKSGVWSPAKILGVFS